MRKITLHELIEAVCSAKMVTVDNNVASVDTLDVEIGGLRIAWVDHRRRGWMHKFTAESVGEGLDVEDDNDISFFIGKDRQPFYLSVYDQVDPFEIIARNP